jgi:hypothetical protein
MTHRILSDIFLRAVVMIEFMATPHCTELVPLIWLAPGKPAGAELAAIWD